MILSEDITTRQRTTWNPDVQDGSVVVATEQDVQPVIEANKAKFNQNTGGFKGDMHHVARIPMVVMEQLFREGLVDVSGRPTDERRFLAWLDDPANRAWRTKPGRLSR